MDQEIFKKFIKIDSRRLQFMTDFFKANNVDTATLKLDGKNHLYINFPKSSYDSSRKIKTVIAHYDRVKNSEGANDNSLAVFILMNWAVKLYHSEKQHNIRLIFTDGEEMPASTVPADYSVENQGSFALASIFSRLNLLNDEIFVFDCMGRGTIPVVNQLDFSEKVPEDFVNKMNELKIRTDFILKKATDGAYLHLPVQYSDNAGFIAKGIPAVLITMLPLLEVKHYLDALENEPNLKPFIRNNYNPKDQQEKSRLLSLIPETWKLINSERDSFYTLTKESPKVFEKILETLEDA